MVKSHTHYHSHIHNMEHYHYVSGSTSSDKIDITIVGNGSHSHDVYGYEYNPDYPMETHGVERDFFTNRPGFKVGYTNETGYHGHDTTQTAHSHTWGAWSGNSYLSDHVTVRTDTGVSSTQYTDSNDSNALENRPKNVTIRIWVRTR